MNLIEVRAQGQFVGSVNSDVYHYPSCTYAQRIKPENKIWFADAADAQSHGYRPCKVCHPPIPELAPFHMLVAAIIISSMIIILKRKSLYLGSHARFRDA
jgi:methylphosphotriester-DNA--protein-cysteine methyltransferase